MLGAGLTGVVIALGVVYTPTFARLMRGQVLTITAREYVDAARALGAPGWRIAWHHVLPNATAPIVVQASLSVAFAILAEASLSFLGLGIQPPGRLVGQHDQRGPRLPPAGAVDRLRPGRGAVRHGGRAQLRGRCACATRSTRGFEV